MKPEDIGVLIVEDEPRLRDLLVQAAGGWGFVCDGTHSGEEAIRMMETRPRQVVVMDLNLPGMGGMECLSAIKRRWPTTLGIVLTGFGDLDSARAAIRLDVVDFLTKPCRMGDLEQALARAQQRLSQASKPAVVAEEPVPPPLDEGPITMEEVERRHILAALSRHGGNRAAAAEELGISLRTLYYRLTEYQKKGYISD